MVKRVNLISQCKASVTVLRTECLPYFAAQYKNDKWLHKQVIQTPKNEVINNIHAQLLMQVPAALRKAQNILFLFQVILEYLLYLCIIVEQWETTPSMSLAMGDIQG